MARFLQLFLFVCFIQNIKAACKNDPNFKYGGYDHRFCSNWVVKDRRRCDVYDDVNNVFVRDKCKKTCGKCKKKKKKKKKPTGKKCKKSKQCKSGICRGRTCFASEICNSFNITVEDAFFANTIVLVVVGSGFSTIESWEEQAHKLNDGIMDDKFPFLSDPSAKLRSFYVRKITASFCDLGCNLVDRLLCCDIAIAKQLVSNCFPSNSRLQTIVIHNDSNYGAAGYAQENIATISTHNDSSLLALHELGHSLFEFGDEYSYAMGSTPKVKPNCDVAGCPKWSDLDDHLELNGRLCQVKGCSGGESFIGTGSFMRNIWGDVGEVNLRYTCCTHLALTKSYPSYCEKYNFDPGLLKYCQLDHQKYGGPSAYIQSRVNNGINTPPADQTLRFVSMLTPRSLLVTVDEKEYKISSDRCSNCSFKRRQVWGDCDVEGDCNTTVVITYVSNEIQTLFYQLTNIVGVPPYTTEDTNQTDFVEIITNVMEIVVDATREKIKDLYVNGVQYKLVT